MQTKNISVISYKELETYTGIVLYESGTKYWLLNGKRHRTDGPAVEFADGSKAWYLYDKRHRTNGPAMEFASGSKEWYYQDQFIKVKTQEEFESWLKVLAFE